MDGLLNGVVYFMLSTSLDGRASLGRSAALGQSWPCLRFLLIFIHRVQVLAQTYADFYDSSAVLLFSGTAPVGFALRGETPLASSRWYAADSIWARESQNP